MAYLEDLKDKIRAAYLKILEHKYSLMALFIGHLYLENQGAAHKFAVGNITDNSSIEEISALTTAWQNINSA
jgi:hypothetical protein